MPASFAAKIISPTQVLFAGDAAMVACRTQVGEIAFLAGHVPLVGALDTCKVRVILPEDEGEQVFAAKGGFIEVRGNTVTVLCDTALPQGEIDEEYLETARAAASGGASSPGDATSADASSVGASSADAARNRRWVELLEEIVGA